MSSLAHVYIEAMVARGRRPSLAWQGRGDNRARRFLPRRTPSVGFDSARKRDADLDAHARRTGPHAPRTVYEAKRQGRKRAVTAHQEGQDTVFGTGRSLGLDALNAVVTPPQAAGA